MRFLNRVALVVAAFAVTMAMSTKADAALLTLNDGADVWTLNVATSCDICLVTLQVQYGLNGTSSHEGDVLSSVQWSINPPELMPQNAAAIGYASFTASSGTGTKESWSFSLNNLNNNDCTGGSGSKACGQWVALTPNAFGFGPIADGMALSWTFNTNFAETFTALTSGNIRAAYNDAVTGKNAGIFSPNGGNFGVTGGGTAAVPEPASLLLFGIAAFAGAGRVRRRRSA